MKYTHLGTFMATLLLFLSGAAHVFSAEYIVTPLALNYDLESRDLITDTITLINNENRILRVYATVNTVATDGEGVVEGFVHKVESDRSNTPTSWIEISRGRIELQPGETREIPFTIRMNPETDAGDYNVFIGFADASNRPQAQTKVNQGKALGTILHIQVDSKQNQFLRLEQFLIDKFITESDSESLTYELVNPGTVPVTPAGEVIFYDNSGSEVTSMNLNGQKKVIAGGGTVSFVMDVPEELSIGKYKAFLSVEYGEHLTASVHDTTFFYVLPLKMLILIFVIILILAVIVALYIHRRYDVDEGNNDGSEYVAMHVREGISEDLHHDIDLSKKE
ncbi:MAG: hypothetical protein ACI9H6_000832 [Patiriisocius sp.]|jgi:hypothetical protein